MGEAATARTISPKFDTKFSGQKDVYPSGATRDNQSGKGRFDLIPPAMLRRLACVYERGAVNHGDRNWEKGIPYSRLFNSAFRHLTQAINGEMDEDHLAQCIWQLAAICHFDSCGGNDLNDMPWHDNPLKLVGVQESNP